MSKMETLLLLIGVFGLVITAGALIYNLFTGSLDNE